MASEEWKFPWQEAKPGPTSGSKAVDWVEGFGRSTLEAIPEVFGVEASDRTQAWRLQNPASGLASELVGMAVPYGGWYKGISKIPKFTQAIDKIGKVEKAPFLFGALREGAKIAPFEFGVKPLANAVIGDRATGDMLWEGALNTAIAGGVGGLLGSIAASGPVKKGIGEIVPGADLDLPLPLLHRQVKELVKAAPSQEGLDAVFDLERRVLGEVAPRGEFVKKLVNDVTVRPEGVTANPPEFAATRQLNRLMGARGDGSVVQVKKFLEGTGPGLFDTKEKAVAKAIEFGLPENWTELAQYPRYVGFSTKRDFDISVQRQLKLQDQLTELNAKLMAGKMDPEVYAKRADDLQRKARFSPNFSTKAAANVKSNLEKGLQSAGDGWYIGRESDDGLYVIAKRRSRTGDMASPADEWFIAKTDRPGAFMQDQDRWTQAQLNRLAWVPGQKVGPSGIVGDTLAGFQKQFPYQNYANIEPTKLGPVVDRFLPKNIKDAELVRRMQTGVREYLAPAMFQFRKSPLANYIHNAARTTYDSAMTTAQELVYGKLGIAKDKNLFWGALRQENVPFEGMKSVKEILDGLSDEDITGLWKLWKNQQGSKQADVLASNGFISGKLAAAVKELESLDEFNTRNIRLAQEAAGEDEIKTLGGHLGLSRFWDGDTRIALVDNAGALKGIAAGATRQQALSNAKRIAQKEGLRVDAEFDLSTREGLDPNVRMILRTPSWMLERKNLIGFKWYDEAFTRDELLDAFANSYHSRYRYQANLAINNQLSGKLEKLAIQDPNMYRILQARLNDLAGVKSAADKLQNQVVDRVLAPVLGTNSATKIVGVTNTILHTLQLGALKLSYPLINLLTAIQTTMPEIAFVLSAPSERVAATYSYLPIRTNKGVSGIVAGLDPLKIMYKSMGEMRKPSADLRAGFARATNERVMDARLVEEYVGESGSAALNMRKALASPGGFAKWLLALSDFLPANAERLSRAHTFTSMWMVGRDHLGMSGEALYQFAKKGTERSMYLYSSADRPRIFTTPMGSAFGVFKNWMMHYIAMMVEYSGEAARGNFAPLLWQSAGTFAVGGLAATPLYGLADAFSESFAGQDVQDYLYENLGEAGDLAIYGLPAYLTGYAFTSSVSQPGSNPIRDAGFLMDFALLQRASYAGQAFGSAFDVWQATGQNPITDQRVREQLARAFMPTTVYRGMATAEGGAVKSLMTGLPQVKDLSFAEQMMYSMGFTPVQMEKVLSVANAVQSSNEKRKNAISQNGRLLADALLNGDSMEADRILKMAAYSGLDLSSVMRSAKARMAGMAEDNATRRMSAADMVKYQNVLGGY